MRLSRPFLLLLWSGCACILAPLVRGWLYWRAAKGKEDPARLNERRGQPVGGRPEGGLVWFHAASVGEILSLLPVISAVQQKSPGLNILITSMTRTSAEIVQRYRAGLPHGDKIRHQFVPLDVPGWVARFLNFWRPNLAVLVESELWPNLIDQVRRRSVPLVLLNGRLSEKSYRNWARVPRLAAYVFGSFRHVFARSAPDAQRIGALRGAAPDGVGDMKLAAPPLPVDEAEHKRISHLLAGRPLWLACSTHKGEEEVIARAHELACADIPGLLCVIVPRHPHRGAEIASLLGHAPRRALGQEPGAHDRFWVADTLGETGLFYRLAPCAFIGNSLHQAKGSRGGHNPLEAIRLECAVATGPFHNNFSEIFALLGAGAAVTADARALAAWVCLMLQKPELCAQHISTARQALVQADHTVQHISRVLLSYLGGEA